MFWGIFMAVQCHTCGRVGEPKVKGSFIVTIVLLIVWILPGIIYEIWRRSSGGVCKYCGSNNIHFYTPPQIQELQTEQNGTHTKLLAHDAFSYNAGQRIPQEQPVEEQAISETKECPFCAETIRTAAIKCKHCGSMLE